VRRSTIGIALRRFGAIGGGRGVAFVQQSRIEERERERERERKRENRISLNIDIWELPMQLRGAGGSALILAVRISSGVEKKIQRWGVSK
jgi:hypothetical protein